MNNEDYIGKKINKLTVLSYLKKDKRIYFNCSCECGNIKIIRKDHFLDSHTKSCGCLNKVNPIKHGLSGTRFYKIWNRMKLRCSDKNNNAFKHYGGRGIKVCKRWIDFNKFKDDMHESYIKSVMEHGENNTTIDRIDVDGNYELSNCRWATRREQSLNTRRSKLFKAISPLGDIFTSKHITLFAKEYNLTYQTIGGCLKGKYKFHKGWSFEYL